MNDYNFSLDEVRDTLYDRHDIHEDFDSTDPLKAYFREINRYFVLTPQRETQLAYQVRAGDPHARARDPPKRYQVKAAPSGAPDVWMIWDALLDEQFGGTWFMQKHVAEQACALINK